MYSISKRGKRIMNVKCPQCGSNDISWMGSEWYKCNNPKHRRKVTGDT